VSDNKPEEVTEAIGPGGDKETTHSHESYGLLRFSRISGGHDNLFGSSIKHGEKISMEVTRATKRRNLNQYWYSPKEHLIEIMMSPSQFAEAITSMNHGCGIPITINYVGREHMSECPETNERQKFEDEFKQDVEDATQLMVDMEKEIGEILSKKSVNKGDREQIRALTQKLIRQTRSHLTFVQSQFNEACDATVKEAKAEVEATILHAIVDAGLDAIASGDAQQMIRERLPHLQLDEGDEEPEETDQ
jgi:hypothetical protein